MPDADEVRMSRAAGWLVPGFYLLVATMLAGIYLQMTAAWSGAAYDSYVRGTMQYPQALGPFRHRLLMPLLGRALGALPGLEPLGTFRLLTALCLWGILLAYRALLGNVLEPGRAALLAPAIGFPLLWNYCLLNRLYFPFDLPAVLFFTLGYHWIWRRRWAAYYPLLVVATLNRETAGFLIVLFALGWWGTMPGRRLAAHLAAQAALWGLVVGGVGGLPGGRGAPLSTGWLVVNLNVVRDMLTLRGHALKDWAKLALAFGGAWWLVPWVWRAQERFVRRACLVVAPFVAVCVVRAILDEVRQYGDLIPVLTTPVVLAAARVLGPPREDRSPRSRAPGMGGAGGRC